MKKKISKKLIYRMYDNAYKSFDRLTPLLFDCGELCNARCCKGKDGMYLFPYEEIFIGSHWENKITYIKNDIPLLICDGICQREHRPLSCRIFPLFPYIIDSKLKVDFDLRAKNICPLQFNDIAEIQIQKKFKRKVYRVFKKLIKNKDIYDFCSRISEEILFLEKFY